MLGSGYILPLFLAGNSRQVHRAVLTQLWCVPANDILFPPNPRLTITNRNMSYLFPSSAGEGGGVKVTTFVTLLTRVRVYVCAGDRSVVKIAQDKRVSKIALGKFQNQEIISMTAQSSILDHKVVASHYVSIFV
jgi:hypothetical protein